MGTKKWARKLTSLVLSVAVLLSPLLPAGTGEVQASGMEWDPLQEWLPENGQSFDPAADLQRGLTQQGQTVEQLAGSPILAAEDVQPGTPEDPIDVTTGSLVLKEMDFSYSTFGPSLTLERSYSSEQAETTSIFGHGWSIPQDRYLQMYDNFAISDVQANGTRENYNFTKEQPDLLVEQYDDDPVIYYPLHLGSYAAAGSGGQKELRRRGPTDYVIWDDEAGYAYAFYGYKAPWRGGQSPKAGKLLRYANRAGLTMWIDYDEMGRMKSFKGHTPPKLTFGYEGNSPLVSTVTDMSGLTYRYLYDGAGNLTKITRPDGSTVEMTYDGDHRMTSRSENGVRTRYVYTGGKVTAIQDAQGRTIYAYRYETNKVTRTDADGNSVVYTIAGGKVSHTADSKGVRMTFNTEGKVTSIATLKGTTAFTYQGNVTLRTDPLGRVSRIENHPLFQKPTLVVEPSGAEWHYTYNDKGTLTSITDPLGRTTRYEVDSFWQVTMGSADPSGRGVKLDYNNPFAKVSEMVNEKDEITKYTYDNSMRLTRVEYPGGRTVTMEYTGGSRSPSKIRGPLGSETRFVYEKGRLVERIDQAGESTKYRYNALGQVDQVTEPGDVATTYTYTPMGHVASVVYGDGRQVEYQWQQGRLVKISGKGVAPAEYEYDAYGLVTKVKTAAGTTEYERDAMGRVVTLTSPGGKVTEYAYNAAGLVEEVTDALEHRVSYTYDVYGNMLTKTDPLDGTTTYAYDQWQQLTDVTDPQGRTTSYTYDVLGRVLTVTDPEERVTEYVYDVMGNVLEEKFGTLITTYEYDAEGRLVAQTNPADEVTAYRYDNKGRLVEKIDPREKSTTYTYHPNGRAATQTDALGRTYHFAYDPAGRLAELVDPRGHSTRFRYDLEARTTEIVRGEGISILHRYDPAGNLIEVVDENGHSTEYKYDGDHRLTEVVTPLGTTRYRYDAVGQLTQEIDPLNHAATYAYDALGRVTSVTDPNDAVTAYSYDPLGLYVEVTLPNGKTTRYEYNKVGDLLSYRDAENGVTKYEYDEAGRLVAKTNPREHTANYAYDNVGRLTTLTDPKGYETTLTYDKMGNLLTRQNALGQVWSYMYDDGGRLTAVTDPMSQTMSYAYDANDNLVGITDVMNRQTVFAYDPLNRLIEQTDTGGTKTSYVYDKADNLLQEIDHDGEPIQFTYDALNRPVAVTDREGITAKTVYDAAGQVVATTDGNGSTTRYSYDPAGRLTQVTDALENVTSYRYDTMGNLVEQTDPLDHSITWTYDGLSRLTSETDGLGQTTSYLYDGAGNMIGRKDAAGATTGYVYDERQLLTQINSPNGNVTFTYDVIGRMTGASNDAAAETYGLDPLGRITSVTNQHLGKTVTYSYDAIGNKTGITDSDGRVTAYTYNDRDQIRSVTDPEGFVTSYEYNPSGQMHIMRGGDQTVTEYEYNKNRYLTKIHTTTATGVLESLNYTYDGAGNLLSQTEADGAVTSFAYDKLSRLVEAVYPVEKIEEIRNTYYTPPLNKLTPLAAKDPGAEKTKPGGNGNGKGNSDSDKGNGKGPQDKGPGKGNGYAYGKYKKRNNSTYDPASLQELGYPANYVPEDPDFFLNPVEHVTYTYDAAGNRASMTDDYGQVVYQYDAANRLTAADGETYAYDANGNLTSKTTAYGLVNYAYNADNQLKKVSYADQTYVQYDYDAFGRKVYREEQFYDLNGPGASMGSNSTAQGNESEPSTGGVIKNYHLKQEKTQYLYDGFSLLGEYNADDELLAQYYRGANDQVLSRKMFGFQGRKDQGYLGNLRDRGHQLFYHYDVTGNVTDLTDHTGSEVLKYRYEAFGGVFTQLWNPYNQVGLTGKSYDIKASQMDYSARWYSPVDGRFTSQDTWPGYIDDPQSQNRYIYALNNPLKYADPTGHTFCSIQIGECDMSREDPKPPVSGGGGGGGNSGGGGDIFDPVDPDPISDAELERLLKELLMQQKKQDLHNQAGAVPIENLSRTERLTMVFMFLYPGQYNSNQNLHDNMEAATTFLTQWHGSYNDRTIQQAIGMGLQSTKQQQYCQTTAGLTDQACRIYIGMHSLIGAQSGMATTAGNLAPVAHRYQLPDPTPVVPEVKTRVLKPGTVPTAGVGNVYKYWTDTTEFKNVKVYQRNDIIDPNKTDAMGRTNLQRMKQGLAPLGPDGKSVNLHHTTQRNEGSIAEVTQTFHQDYSKIIHINPNTIPSGINRKEFEKWRKEYWKNRVNDFQ